MISIRTFTQMLDEIPIASATPVTTRSSWYFVSLTASVRSLYLPLAMSRYDVLEQQGDVLGIVVVVLNPLR